MNTRLISTGICQRGSAEKSDNKTRMEKSRLLRDYFWETLLREKKLKWASVPAMTPTGILRSAEVELRGISGKGIGVFAKKSIDRGTIFGYGGVHVCSDYFRANQKRLSRVSYVILLSSGAYIDPHPSCGQNHVLWIGSNNICACNNILMMMHAAEGSTRHVLAVRDGIVIDSLHRDHIISIKSFHLSLLDRGQKYYKYITNILQIYYIIYIKNYYYY